MLSPTTANELQTASEKSLSDALRETFQKLEIDDLSPEAIMERFSKSGGIDRVRIAVERRMKEVTEVQKSHTLAASEDFLNKAVPEGSEVPAPQGLMQHAQKVVLATVKDRIGKDVDSVTEQGTAAWFFECVQNEMIKVCSEEDTAAKDKAEPAPVTKVVDGAKAILARVSRNVARARQADHTHDPGRVNPNREKLANMQIDPTTNGKLGNDHATDLTATKGNHTRTEIAAGGKKNESPTERVIDIKRDGREDNVARRTKDKVHDHPLRKVGPSELPSSGRSLPTTNTEGSQKNDTNVHDNAKQSRGTQLVLKGEVEEEAHPSIRNKDVTDYEALADDLLFGENSDEDRGEQEGIKAVKSSTSPPAHAAEKISDNRPEPQAVGLATAEQENRPKQAKESAVPSPSPENCKEVTKTEPVAQQNASTCNEEKNLSKPSTPRSTEISKMDVEERPPTDEVQAASEGTTVPAPRQKVPGDGEMKKDGLEAGSTTKENHNTCKAVVIPIEAAKSVEREATSAISEDRERENEGNIERETDMVIAEKEKSEDTPKENTQNTAHTHEGADIILEAAYQDKKLHFRSKEDTEGVDKRRKELDQENISSRSLADAKVISETGKTEEDDQGSTTGNEELPELAGDEEGLKSKNHGKSDHSADKPRPRSGIDAAQTVTRTVSSPRRRASRRLSSRVKSTDEQGVRDSMDSESQKPAISKKTKTPRGRPKRKNNESSDGPVEDRRKITKGEPTKSRKERNVKKRNRSETKDDLAPSQTQRSTDFLDPADPKRPRGYSDVRSCVPQDFAEQQKILNALKLLLQKECSGPFAVPVDTTAEGCEMYSTVVTNPMDLGEICERLEQSSAETGYYLTQGEVLEDIELVWWNCKKYNGHFDPIIVSCEESKLELSFLLEQHGIELGRGGLKRRRVSRGPEPSVQKLEEEAALGDNDGHLVGKTVLIFTSLKKGKKEWFTVKVTSYDAKSKSYTLRWVDKGRTTKKATFGASKMYPVYRI